MAKTISELLDALRGPNRSSARAELLDGLPELPLDYEAAATLRRELGRTILPPPAWPGEGPAIFHACRAWEAAIAGDDAESLVAEAVGLIGFEDLDTQIAVMEWGCEALLVARRGAALLEQAERAVSLAPEYGRFLMFKGAGLARTGRAEAAETVLRQALESAEEAEDRRALMIIRREIGMTHYLRGDTKTAIEHHLQAVELAEQLQIPDEQMVLIHGLGSLEYQRRRLSEAQTFFEDAVERARALGDPRREAQLIGRLGCVARDRGELERARDLLEQALEAHDGGAGTALVHHELGLLEHVAWYPHAALRHYESAIESAQHERSTLQEAVSSVALGMLRLEQRRLEAATTSFERAAFLAGQSGHAGFEATAIALRAAALALDGDLTTADELIDTAEDRQPVTGSRFDGQLLAAIRGLVAVGHARSAPSEQLRDAGARQARDMLAAMTRPGVDGLRLIDRGADYLLTGRILEGFVDGLETTTRVAPPHESIRVTDDCGTIELETGQLDLRRRAAQRRLVQVLIEHHRAGNEEPLTVWELADAAWPDEPDLHPDVASNRVYSAIWTLRKDGLSQLETTGDGYRFDPRLVIEITEDK